MPDLVSIILYILGGFSIGGFTTLCAGGFEATPDFTQKTNETEEAM